MEVVKFLIRKGGDLEIPDQFGRSPLLVAAAGGHMDVVKEIIRRGTNLSAVDNRGQNVLFAASRYEN